MLGIYFYFNKNVVKIIIQYTNNYYNLMFFIGLEIINFYFDNTKAISITFVANRILKKN